MGRVYLGRTPAGSMVAVKVVHREYAGDRSFRRRFEQEVAAARRVQGLYTVPVVDADLRADEPWLATAYIPGPSLHDAVDEHGPLPADAAVELIARVAEALQSIHSADVIHRDLKPSNIILTAEGPKVIDFGIARAADVTSVTGTGMLTGTPAYMAPEYIRGQDVTGAVDVFALGAVASFAVTGRPAFGGGSHHGVTYRILEQAPDLDGCPEPVRAIAGACLTKDPLRRPTPAEVIRLCHPASTTGSTGGAGHTVPYPSTARTAVSPASPSPDPATSPAPASDPAPSLPSPDPLVPPALPIPVLLGVVGVLALVGILIAVSLPWDSADPDTPSSIEPVAVLTDFPNAGNGVAAAFSPDGKTLASGGDGRVELRDVADHKLRATFEQRDTSGQAVTGIPSLAFSPDGELLAVGTDRGVVGLWDVAHRRQVGLTRGDSGNTVESLAFSPDGKLFATGGGDGVRLWDADSGRERIEEVGVLDGEASIDHVAFSPDGRTLASAGADFDPPVSGQDHSVRLWDMSSRKARKTLYDSRQIWGMAFSPDGKTLALTNEEHSVRLSKVTGGGPEASLSDDAQAALRAVTFSPDGRTLAVVGGRDVTLWNMADRSRRTTLTSGEENVKSVVFRPDGEFFATMTYGGLAQLWKMP